MTIEIRQLVIRAVVDGAPAAEARRDGALPQAAPLPDLRADPGTPEDHQVTVAACVREVMRRLERSRER